ncbi:MAG: diguanylate cyclase [Anaerolineae bacterium]|nr:diguanylate cyclase [Anaerolineae bacterium]
MKSPYLFPSHYILKNGYDLDSLRKLILFGCLFIILVVGYVVAILFEQTRTAQIQEIKDRGNRLVTSFDHFLNLQEIKLNILEAEAQSVIKGEKLPLKMTIADLVQSSQPRGYTLALPVGKKEKEVGNLTGIGDIPNPGTPLADEINMALSLSPIFEQVIDNKTSLPWVYYTSASHFMYLYPRVSPSHFFYDDSLHETAFYRLADPQHNPAKKLIWTPLYNDEAGTGMMVTLSKPVYDGDHFLGTLSIDMSISEIQWLLGNNDISEAAAYLVGPDGKIMVGHGNKELSITPALIDPENLTESNGLKLIIFPLDEVNWYIVLDIDGRKLDISAISGSSHIGLIILSVLFSLSIILIVSRNMIIAQYMAIHDNLTGVLNRRGYEEYSTHMIKKIIRSKSILDIDQFKQFNDFYGHRSGDDILRRVANALQNGLKNPDDSLFRVGGEEFVILIILNTAEDMPLILERLITSVNALDIPHEKSPFNHVTISIGGYAACVDSPEKLEEAYKVADKALYEAKNAGRNRWVIL